jgi:putative ABC transport system permease protein
MKIKDVIITANNNLLRNKTRTILTTLAIIIGSITLLVAESVGNGFEQYVANNLETGSSQIFRLTKKGADKYKYGEITKYKDSKDEDTTQVFRSSDVSYLKNNYSSIIKDVFLPQYLNLAYISRNSYEKFTGNVGIIYPDTTAKLISGKIPEYNQILISLEYVEPLGFLNSDDALGKVVTIGVWDNNEKIAKEFSLVISGVTHKSESTSPIQVNYQTASFINKITSPESANSQSSNSLQIYTEKLSSLEITDFKEKLSNAGIVASSYEDDNKQMFEIVNILRAIMLGVAAISLAVATFGIVNTVLMGILERTKEIGLIKALGGSKKLIFQLFTFEAVCIGFWGYIISVFLAIILGLIINPISHMTFLKDIEEFTLYVLTPFSVIKIFFVVMAVSFGASFFPSLKASKLDPIEALRSE